MEQNKTPEIITEAPAFVKEALAEQAIKAAEADALEKAAIDARTRANEETFNATRPEGISPVTLDPNAPSGYRELTPATIISRHRQF